MVDMFKVSGFMYMSDPPHGMLILDLNAGGSPTPAPSGLTAPTLTKTSSAGQQLAFTVTFDASYVGKYFHLQLAGASNFTTPLAGEGAIRETRQLIIPEDVTSGPVFSILASQPAGAIYARLYIEDDSPTSSAASNIINGTVIISTPTVFNPSNTKSYATISNAGRTLSYDNSAGQAPMGSALTPVQASGKHEIKFTLDFMGATGFTSSIDVGICLASQDFVSGFPQPGKTNNNGLSIICSPHGDMDIYQASAYLTSLSGVSAATGTDNRLIVDQTAQKLWIKVGGTLQSGDNPAAGTGGIDISSWCTGSITFWAAPEGNRAVTIDPAPSGLTSGFSAWGT